MVGRLPPWLFCLASAVCISANAAAQPKFVIIPQLDTFTSISVARRINVTLVSNTEVDKLPVEVYQRLTKNKRAMANIEEGGCVCVIKAEPSVAKAVRCYVEDGSLDIYAEKYTYKRSQAIDVFVVCDDGLRSVSGASSSNLYSKGTLRSQGLSVTADYAMSIRLSVVSPWVRVVANNDSEVWLTGAVGRVDADLDGSTLHMRKLDCGSVAVSASNGAKAWVNASNSLSLSATGHSAIFYAAQGATVEVNSDATSKVADDAAAN